MEVPIERIPQPARGRIESLMRTMRERCSVEKKMGTIELIGKFYTKVFPSFVEKQVGDGEIETWVYERLKRGGDWVEETADSLFEEAVATREEAVRAQLCSSIGKDVPEAYELSGAEEEDAQIRAYESAESVAETYNEKLKEWIEEAKAEWWEEHGESFIGLNRFTLLKLVQAKVEKYDEWKIPEIAVTEFSHEWQQEAMSFWLINKGNAELEYYLSPEDASDPARDTEPICMSYAGRWLSETEASMFPAHCRCIHFISRTRVIDGTLPIYFMIGGIRYLTEELPDC